MNKRAGGNANILWNHFDYDKTKSNMNCRERKQNCITIETQVV